MKLFIIFLNALFCRMEMLLLSCYHLVTNRTKIQSMTKKNSQIKHWIGIIQVLLKLSKHMAWRHHQIYWSGNGTALFYDFRFFAVMLYKYICPNLSYM